MSDIPEHRSGTAARSGDDHVIGEDGILRAAALVLATEAEPEAPAAPAARKAEPAHPEPSAGDA